MKKLLVAVLISFQTFTFSQIGPGSTPSPLSSMVQNPPLGITTWRTILPNPIYDVIVAKGTESWTNNAWSIILPNYATLRDDGFPKRLVYIDSLTGALKVSGNYALDARYLKLSDSTLYTSRHYLQNDFYTKVQSDSMYLQSFTEVDPIFTSHPSYGITSTNILNWDTAYGWGNHAGLYPTYNGSGATGTWNISVSGNAGTVTNGIYSTGNYSNPSWLTSLAWSKITGTPTIYSFAGSNLEYTKGDGTYAVFPTTLSSFTNDAGYLTTINSGQIITALGFTPVPDTRTLTINGVSQNLTVGRTWNVGDVLTSGSYSNPSWITSLASTKITYSGSTSQYVRGDGSLATFPTIPASQVNSDWNSSSGASEILNKPTIPTNTNQLTNGANFITSAGAPVQSVNGQTGTVTLTIPAGQIQSDWNQTNNVALDYIKNKPALGTAASTNSSDYATAAQGVLASTAVQPATLSNYVTNSALTTTLSSYATTTALNSGLSGKENTIASGTTSQYWRGDKTWQTLSTSVVAEGTNLYYTDARARASNSAGTGISYNSATGVITNSSPDQTVILNSGTGISVTGSYPNFTIGSTVSTPTINSNVGRTLNTSYTISTTRLSEVSYSVSCSVTNPLLAGTSTANAFLEYSVDGGSTWIIVNQTGNSSGVGLAVAVAITNIQTTTLTGYVPANALTRIRTTTTGTASVTYVLGQEVLF